MLHYYVWSATHGLARDFVMEVRWIIISFMLSADVHLFIPCCLQAMAYDFVYTRLFYIMNSLTHCNKQQLCVHKLCVGKQHQAI